MSSSLSSQMQGSILVEDGGAFDVSAMMLRHFVEMGNDPLLWRMYLEITRLSVWTIIITFALEATSPGETWKLLRHSPGLYMKGVAANFLNHFVVAPLMFVLYLRYSLLAGKSHLDCDPSRVAFDIWGVPDYSYCRGFDLSHVVIETLAILLIQAIGYYLAHMAMHTKSLYWTHRFHHRFNIVVVPVTANSVSAAEYVIAYMLPIFIGTVLFKPSLPALFSAGFTISLCNILIHTPILHWASEFLPSIFVSTSGHMDHHRKLSRNFAAPTLNVDWLVSFLLPKLSEKRRSKIFVERGDREDAVDHGGEKEVPRKTLRKSLDEDFACES
ncbi:unnamed protein product [Amoebophrya sp. A25]|nr:unnamed protein product [Amoebophrya sp. A25]|eukprot:GSA25T00025249001.1